MRFPLICANINIHEHSFDVKHQFQEMMIYLMKMQNIFSVGNPESGYTSLRMKSLDWSIRPARKDDASAIARVEVDTWRVTYRDLLPESYLQGMSYYRREISWHDLIAVAPRRGYPYVAECRGSLVGFILGGAERYGDTKFPTELYALYILPAHQKKGIGRALVGVLAQQLIADGYSSMLVRVLKDNPASHFYQALGAEFLGSRPELLGSLHIVVLEYGWRDITTLLPAKMDAQ